MKTRKINPKPPAHPKEPIRKVLKELADRFRPFALVVTSGHIYPMLVPRDFAAAKDSQLVFYFDNDGSVTYIDSNDISEVRLLSKPLAVEGEGEDAE